MIALLKRLMGKKQQLRKYQVPDGLADKVVELMAYAESDMFPAPIKMRTLRELWLLIEERCPETNEGEWGLRRIGSRIYVEELA